MSRFKEDADPVASSDLYYDLFNGYIDPTQLLKDPEDMKKVVDAVGIVETFLNDFENSDLFEEC